MQCRLPKSTLEDAKPIFVNRNKTLVLGRSVTYHSKEVLIKMLKSGHDGIIPKKTFSLNSYTMLWNKNTKQFDIKIIENEEL